MKTFKVHIQNKFVRIFLGVTKYLRSVNYRFPMKGIDDIVP